MTATTSEASPNECPSAFSRVLAVHNYYQQWGGEDAEFEAEVELLRSRGHQVATFIKRNQDIGENPLRLAANTIWSRESRRELGALIDDFHPAVVHFHNTLPQVSPAAYRAARDRGVPIVQTVPNYRLVCPSAVLYRDGHICEDCLHARIPWPGVRHACYRGSLPASATVAAMLTVHRLLGSWRDLVDVFVPPSDFVRNKLIEAGFRADQFVVKPNLTRRDAGPGSHLGGFVLFAGRLVPEKGVRTLLDAWTEIGDRIRLRIVGDGPLAPLVKEAAAQNPSIEWLGRISPDQVMDLMGAASMVVVPSVWYEPFGLVATEAFARGTPVIASRIGGLAEIIEDQRTGRLVEAGDATGLARAVLALAADADQRAVMGRAARDTFESKYSAEANYQQLLEIYAAARRSRGRDRD